MEGIGNWGSRNGATQTQARCVTSGLPWSIVGRCEPKFSLTLYVLLLTMWLAWRLSLTVNLTTVSDRPGVLQDGLRCGLTLPRVVLISSGRLVYCYINLDSLGSFFIDLL